MARRMVPKIDAFATMVDLEGEIYAQWLRQPEAILRLFNQFFCDEFCSVRWGKCHYVGCKRARAGESD